MATHANDTIRRAHLSIMTTRRSYTAEFKLQAVRELAANGAASSVRAVAVKHGVTPSMLRKWAASRAELEAAVLGALSRRPSASPVASAQLRKLGGGRPPESRAVDEALAAWVRRQRGDGEFVRDRDMQTQARAIAASLGLEGFRASKGYIFKFKARNGLGSASVGNRRAGAADAVAAEPSQQEQQSTAGACLFGMDIGTTVVRCAVVSASTGGVLATSSAPIEPMRAARESATQDQAAGRVGEQSAAAVLFAVRAAIRQLPDALRAQIVSIGVCGRMHGIMWWRCDAVSKSVDRLFTIALDDATAVASETELVSGAWSKYITFLDQRCTPSFLEKCRVRISRSLQTAATNMTGMDIPGDLGARWESSQSSPIAAGYGLASFSYMLEERPRELVGFDACGTMPDFVAFVLCRHTLPAQTCIDTTNAFCWGGYDMRTKDWNPLTVAALQIPLHMLPTVRAPGQVVGYCSHSSIADNCSPTPPADRFGLPSGTPVYIPMGDHPCTVMAAIAQANHREDGDNTNLTLVNIGTPTQLAVVLSAEDITRLDQDTMHMSFEIRPFLSDHRYLGVAASLNGGNVFALFVQQCLDWSRELAVEPSSSHLNEENMYARLISLGSQHVGTDLEFIPTLNGERREPDARGAIRELRSGNWSLGDISAAICKGVVDNLLSMVPSELSHCLSQQMIGTGKALVRNRLFQYYLGLKAGGRLNIQESADAAVGVAFTPSLLQLSEAPSAFAAM